MVFLLKYKLHPEPSPFNFFFSYGMAVKSKDIMLVLLRKCAVICGKQVPEARLSCTAAVITNGKYRFSGQVLQDPYEFDKGKLVAREMTDQLALDLVEKHLVTDQLVLTVGYDTSNLSDPMRRMRYNGPVRTDHYGRPVPKEAHGSINLDRHTSSGRIITDAMMKLFDRCVDPNLLVRRITVVAAHVLSEKDVPAAPEEQPDLFTDYEALEKQKAAEQAELDKEKRLQQAVLNIKKRMGANAILKGMNLEEGATGKARNEQIGGHRK